IFTAAAAAVTTAANLIALCWFGMWMGMTSKSANLATLKTIVFVWAVPGLIITFGSYMVISMVMIPFLARAGGSQPSNFLMWWPLLSAALAAILCLAKDLGFFVWARRKLYSSFREEAASTLGRPCFS